MAQERTRPDVAARRATWEEERARIPAAHLVFLDETWTKTNLTRLYGWGPAGERVTEAVPHGHWKTTTLLCGIRLAGVVAPLVIDGALNGELFLAWVQQALAPALRPRDVVVLDNLAGHKVAGVQAALAQVGARLLYLPPHSPDLNPIEQFFSWFKSHLRAIKARTVGALWEAIGQLCDQFTPDALANLLAHAGYRFHPAAHL